MKPWVINSGYLAIHLVDDNRVKHKFLVHRVIAIAFIPNPSNLSTVNHKDGNKCNNALCNLEWASYSDQQLHAYRALAKINSCPTKGTKHKSQVSKYHNVGFDKSRNKWISGIRINNINYQQKRFNTEEEAALHVNYLLEYYCITDRPKNVIE